MVQEGGVGVLVVPTRNVHAGIVLGGESLALSTYAALQGRHVGWAFLKHSSSRLRCNSRPLHIGR